MLRGLAIQRLFELDPRAARPYILAEIGRPQVNGGVLAKALTLLPDETLPEFDETLATRLEAPNSPTLWSTRGSSGATPPRRFCRV